MGGSSTMQDFPLVAIISCFLTGHFGLWYTSRWVGRYLAAGVAVDDSPIDFGQVVTADTELEQVLASQRALLGLCERAFSSSTGWTSTSLLVAVLTGFVLGSVVAGYFALRFARGSVAVAHATVQHGDVYGTRGSSPTPSEPSSSLSNGVDDALQPLRRRRGLVLQ